MACFDGPRPVIPRMRVPPGAPDQRDRMHGVAGRRSDGRTRPGRHHRLRSGCGA